MYLLFGSLRSKNEGCGGRGPAEAAEEVKKFLIIVLEEASVLLLGPRPESVAKDVATSCQESPL